NILISFEHAELCDSHTQAQAFMNFVIIGGGPTGVELAGAIAEIANHAMLKNFKRIDPRNARVYLVEGTDRLLPAMSPKMGKRAQADLERLGVEVITAKMVTDITAEGVQVGDRYIHSTNIIWAAGNQAAPLLKSLNTPLDGQGRVLVEPDLTIPGHPEVYVIGDAAHCKGKGEKPFPAVAPVAIQQAQYVADIIRENRVGKETKPFVYSDKGTMATIGKSRAVAMVFGLEYGGFLAWCTWSMIHLMYLTLYKNRMRVLIEWLYGYFTGQRGARLIRKQSEEESIKVSLRVP
ncbi:MAG: FAD-dependent oxidoreductase, partial [Nitrospinae bacterium]|nr:FAD-dependent oxidoreductase [Nitrospinota bacterium]